MKKNSFLDRVQRQVAAAFRAGQMEGRQNVADIAMLVLNRKFGFGAERLRAFADGVQDAYGEWADLWNGDTKDKEFAEAKMDRALKQICGPYFAPWEERYDV